MPTIQIQLSVSFGDESVHAIAQVLGPAIRQAVRSAGMEFDKSRGLTTSYKASAGPQASPVCQEFLIDSRQAAKMLKISERTLWGLHNNGEMPAPIRIGRRVRWNLDVLKKWIDAGCPTTSSKDRSGEPEG